jgi:hypothetical protein
MTSMRRMRLPIALVALLFGCQAPATDAPIQPDAAKSPPPDERMDETPPVPTDEPNKPVEEATEPPPAAPVVSTLGDGTPVELVPSHPDAFIRVRRRMDLGQLNKAIKRATGGIGWTNSSAWSCVPPGYVQKTCTKGVDQFEKLSATLGVPDYLLSVTEERSAGPVFQKFLGDAARSVCTKLVEAEVESPPEERVLIVHASLEDTVESAPEAVQKNLSLLLLRYHGIKVSGPGDPAIQRWRWLFHTIVKGTKQPVQGWKAVCIGLIQHPDFYSY